MSTDLLTVGPCTALLEAVEVMVDQGINCLPVVAGDQPLGILTSTDLHLIIEQLLQSASVEQPV